MPVVIVVQMIGLSNGFWLTSLPYALKTAPWVQVNHHGLALWVTTPVYVLLLWPKRTGWTFWALALAVVPVMIADLCYQNSGWLQFGYRFSNDYAVLHLSPNAHPMQFLRAALGEGVEAEGAVRARWDARTPTPTPTPTAAADAPLRRAP